MPEQGTTGRPGGKLVTAAKTALNGKPRNGFVAKPDIATLVSFPLVRAAFADPTVRESSNRS